MTDLKDISDRADLFTNENSALLADLMHTDAAGFERLMNHYRGRGFKAIRQIEEHVKRTLKAMLKASKAKKAGGFQLDASGDILTNQFNILTAFEKLGVDLKYDAFKGCPIIEGLPGKGPLLDDPALKALYFEVDGTFNFRANKPYFEDFVIHRCHENSFHPVLDYLDGITWDGVARLDTWLSRYAGIEDTY